MKTYVVVGNELIDKTILCDTNGLRDKLNWAYRLSLELTTIA